MVAFRVAACMLIILLGLAIVSGCGKSGGSSRSSAPPRPQAAQDNEVAKPKPPKFYVESKGVGDLSWQVGGQYVLRASGETLTADEATGKATFLKAKAELYRNGKRATLISADRIEADVTAGVLTAKGGVVARSMVKDIAASVAELTWTQNDQKIIGEGGVKLKSDVGDLSADRLEADTEMDNIKLTSNTGGHASLKAAALE